MWILIIWLVVTLISFVVMVACDDREPDLFELMAGFFICLVWPIWIVPIGLGLFVRGMVR